MGHVLIEPGKQRLMTSRTSADGPRRDGIRFGLTIVSVAAGQLVDQPVEALIVTGNSRGLLGAGPTGSLRPAAGPEPEREARKAAPHELGTAFATSPGGLADRGIVGLIHAVVSVGLGEPPQVREIPAALAAALSLSRAARHRSLALPILGVSAVSPVEERMAAAEVVIEALVTHLRTPGGRPERAILVSRFEDDIDRLTSLVTRARERLWTGPV